MYLIYFIWFSKKLNETIISERILRRFEMMRLSKTVYSNGSKGVPPPKAVLTRDKISYNPPTNPISVSKMKREHIDPIRITAAIITVSSTRTPETDTSGARIRDSLKAAQIETVYYTIVSDRVELIRDRLFEAEKEANCIVLNGGTGLTRDDCTIEAIAPLLEKTIDGFGEMFRMNSIQEVGTAALLSRAVGGIRHGKAIFCIPGSTPAVALAMDGLIIPEIAHILSHANK